MKRRVLAVAAMFAMFASFGASAQVCYQFTSRQADTTLTLNLTNLPGPVVVILDDLGTVYYVYDLSGLSGDSVSGQIGSSTELQFFGLQPPINNRKQPVVYIADDIPRIGSRPNGKPSRRSRYRRGYTSRSFWPITERLAAAPIASSVVVDIRDHRRVACIFRGSGQSTFDHHRFDHIAIGVRDGPTNGAHSAPSRPMVEPRRIRNRLCARLQAWRTRGHRLQLHDGRRANLVSRIRSGDQ